jgi:hypothetical protein
MGWTIPTFTNGETSGVTAGLNALAADLVLLNASPQLNSVAATPLVGVAPALSSPNFLLDVNYQSRTTTTGGIASFTFGAAFPNGVVAVVAMPADGTGNGTTFDFIQGDTTLSGFAVQCHYLNSGNYVVAPSGYVTVGMWIAVGF